jgi:proton-dependent oligopeptide transporter, POT family
MSDTNRFPPQIKYIIGNEACERFSFYGMRSILVIFMVQQLAMTQADSKAVFHYFVSAAYFMPLLGGYISDRFLGKYKTIMWVSMIYCVGHLLLAIFEGSKEGLYSGLALIAIGSGGIKACVSAHVGDQFTQKNKHLVKKVFDLFYFSVNFGSFFSTLLIPWILPRYGAAVAFGIPGILMAMATVVFWMGRTKYVHVPPTGKTGEIGFGPIFLAALSGKRKKGQGFFDAAAGKYKPSDIEAAKAAANIFKVFAGVSIFWALFDQHSSSWILQAQNMHREFMGMHIEASQMAAMNPIMVMMLIPLFSWGLYPFLEKLGFSMAPLKRMGLGMWITASSFIAAGIIEQALTAGVQVNVMWQFIQYLLLTSAEVMVSITGLEFAYTQAPRSMKSTIMSFWLLTVFAGNMVTAWVSEINVFKGATFFYFFAILMAVVSAIFVWMANRYKGKEYLEDGTFSVDPALAED